MRRGAEGFCDVLWGLGLFTCPGSSLEQVLAGRGLQYSRELVREL
jgi:hypothetical protein